jgi:hypothetical protein
LIAAGAQAIEAGKESERGASAVAGRVQMAQQQGQREIATAMGQEMLGLEKLSAQEDARLRDVGIQLDLAEAEGAQLAAAQSAEAANLATQQGLQGVINDKAKWIIPAVYKIIKAVNVEMFIVSDGEKFGLMNSKGDIVLEMIYSQIRLLNKDLLLLNLNDDVKYFHLIDSKIIQLAPSKDE